MHGTIHQAALNNTSKIIKFEPIMDIGDYIDESDTKNLKLIYIYI